MAALSKKMRGWLFTIVILAGLVTWFITSQYYQNEMKKLGIIKA